MPGPCRSTSMQDLRHEVADLRAHHCDRVAGRRLPGGDELPVGGVAGGFDRCLQALADGCGRTSRRDRGAGRLGEADAAGLRQRQAALGEGAAGLIGKALGDRRRRLGVVLGAEVRPGPAAGLLPHPLDERLHRQRRVQLVAAALAEDAADQRSDRDHVGRLPRFHRLVQERVLARLQCWDRGWRRRRRR